jgi:hypothetical protein
MSKRSARRVTESAAGQLRGESWALVNVSGAAEPILPDGERDIAELVGCPSEDLTKLPYGIKSMMWMRRSAQLDESAPLNVPATHALKLCGLLIAVRGPVVVHHAAADLIAEKKKLRAVQRNRAEAAAAKNDVQ